MIKPQYEDWTNLYGQNFETITIKQAMDMYDIVNNYGLNEEALSTFIREDINIGCRLFLAMNLKSDSLGIMLMKEDDERIINVIKERLKDLNMGLEKRNSIILPEGF